MGEPPITERAITESVITERVKWTHVEAPDDAAVRQLVAGGLPATLVAHALDIDEVPRIDREGGYKLVVLRVLATRTDRLAALRTVALGVMIAPGAVYTITRGPTSIAARLASSKPDRAAAVLVEVLAALAAEFLAAVREIDRNVEVIEGQLANSQRNREVLALLEQQKALVRIVTALRANRIVADRLVEDTHIELDAEARDRLGDAMVELHQALEMVTVSSDILSQMMDAFASIISNNLNVVMKMLTALTIVLTGPMLVASLWGMNVELPLQRTGGGFWGLIGLSLAIAGGVWLWFRRRGWL